MAAAERRAAIIVSGWIAQSADSEAAPTTLLRLLSGFCANRAETQSRVARIPVLPCFGPAVRAAAPHRRRPPAVHLASRRTATDTCPVPGTERTLGQDRLTRWHRLLAPWALVLIAAHGALITAGYSQSARTGLLHQFGVLIGSYPGILATTVAFVLLMAAGFTSARIARRRMRYETWWAVHLYTYLALALSFSHQLATGASFVGHPVARTWWTALWIITAGTVLAYRILLPGWRSLVHQLRVVAIEPVAPGVVSVLCRGRRLSRMPLSGGQFLQWRILKPGLWWQAHPYSVSAVPDPPYLRFTVKDLGDHSGSLAHLTPSTRSPSRDPTARSRSMLAAETEWR